MSAARHPKVVPLTRRVVDELCDVLAQIDALEERAIRMKSALVKCGPGEYTGTLHRAVVTQGTRETLEPEKVRRLLTKAQIRRCTKKTPYSSVRIYGR